jgi:hypothetical protein
VLLFSHGTVFFSHNKSVSSSAAAEKSANRTECWKNQPSEQNVKKYKSAMVE